MLTHTELVSRIAGTKKRTEPKPRPRRSLVPCDSLVPFRVALILLGVRDRSGAIPALLALVHTAVVRSAAAPSLALFVRVS